MRFVAIFTLAVILAGCAASTGPKYLNKDGNAASWGAGKRTDNPSLSSQSNKEW